MGIDSRPCYDSFNPHFRAQRQKKLWDPASTLGIINPDRGSLTCVGYAPSCGRRCRNPINQGNRSAASGLLDELSYIDVSTTNIDAKLYQLARFTLCLRYHQNQQKNMVEKWSRMIDEAQATQHGTEFKSERNEVDERLKHLEELLEQLLNRCQGPGVFTSSATADKCHREQYDRRSSKEEEKQHRPAQEDRAQNVRDEAKQKEKKRERDRQQEQKREQQERDTEESENTERRRREEAKMREEAQTAKEREAREREEFSERIRQRAERMKRQREEKAAKERKEWDQVWVDYVRKWDVLKRNDTKATSEKLQDIIPWPVRSYDCKDVSETAIEEFYQKALLESSSAEKLSIIKMECLKWHTDRIPRTFGVIKDKTLEGLFNKVAQVVVEVRAKMRDGKH